MFLLLSIVREKHRLDVDELTGVKKGALDRFHTHACLLFQLATLFW
jgi:hypothetical protein